MRLIRKLGIKKFLILLSVGMSFISLLSGVLIAYTYNNNVKSITNSFKSNANANERVINQTIDASYINTMVMALLTQKDIDLLERDIKAMGESRKLFSDNLDQCGGDCASLKEIYQKYEKELDEIINKKILMGKYAEGIEYYITTVSKTYQSMLDEISGVSMILAENGKKSIAESEAKYRVALKIIIIASVVLIILSILMGIIFKKVLISLLVEMSSRLHESYLSVKDSADNVAGTSHSLSEAATEQASSIQSSSQAVHEISEMINRNSEHAKSSASKSQESQARIEEGKLAIEDMLKAMRKISDSNERIDQEAKKNEKEFQEITKLISEISEKTKIINDIVFQTKLLSFNASVEAARAGEHGKGFAVVAEEVGNLATMSGTAATEINAMLETSIKRVNEIANASKVSLNGLIVSGKASVDDGNQSAKKCDEIFERIGEEASQINVMLQEIDEGTKEQAQGIVEVNGSMNELNQATEKNSQMAQSAATLASKLQSDSESLEAVVDELNKTLNGA